MASEWHTFLKEFRRQNKHKYNANEIQSQASAAYKEASLHKKSTKKSRSTSTTPPKTTRSRRNIELIESQKAQVEALEDQIRELDIEKEQQYQQLKPQYMIPNIPDPMMLFTNNPLFNLPTPPSSLVQQANNPLTFVQEEFKDGIMDLGWINNEVTPDGAEAARYFIERILQRLKNSNRFPKLKIGTIKITKQYGNTSVSMGLATFFLEQMKKQNSNFAGHLYVLNYGGGGPTVQVYWIDCMNNFVSFKCEESQKGKEQDIGTGKPVGMGFHELESNPQWVYKDISALLDQVMNLVGDKTPKNQIMTAALVTGKSRELVLSDKVTQNDRYGWYLKANDAFSPLIVDGKINDGVQFQPWNSALGLVKLKQEASYFIPQKIEGTFELVGIQKLYSNLKNHVNRDVYEVPFASLGIGTTTTQITVEKFPLNQIGNQKIEDVADVEEEKFGMKVNTSQLMSEANANSVAQKLISSNSKFAQRYDELVRTGRTPILALKSGALLRRADLIKDFTLPKPPSENVALTTPNTILAPNTAFINPASIQEGRIDLS